MHNNYMKFCYIFKQLMLYIDKYITFFVKLYVKSSDKNMPPLVTNSFN